LDPGGLRLAQTPEAIAAKRQLLKLQKQIPDHRLADL
jgi:hypothetical protein